jgi:4a-hydroxytetrahydrobiopterin dehydratase
MEKLNQEQINEKLKNLQNWSLSDSHIEKEFQLKDFKSALGFINKIGDEAEKMDHHPDIFLHSYNKVKITLSTHSAGGVTNNDIELAGKIENLNK